MDPSILMLLPKGIVTNNTDIYDEVASYPTVPPDKVYEYWHVYTTTNKKLKDPTARRLENFWWHVWGSDRRSLSGRALARIFEDISVGPTFVPLRGPANRWEGPDVPRLTVDMILAHLRSGALPPAQESDAAETETCRSQSSRPSQPQPILKKSLAPPSSRPRPTARVVSPHESDDECDSGSDAPSSGSTLATGLDDSNLQPHGENAPLPSQSQLPAPSSTLSQRSTNTKPSSSQISSSGSGSDLANNSNNFSLHNTLSINRHSGGITGSRPSNNNNSSSPIESRRDRPAARKLQLANGISRTSSSSSESRTDDGGNALHPRPSDAASQVSDSRQSILSLSQQTGAKKHADVSPAITPKQGLFTGATASTTKVAAQGTIIDQSGNADTLSEDVAVDNSSAQQTSSIHRGSSSSPMLDARLMPTQPTNSASLPLGRTKSQLTLLLEREKDRHRGR